jgi:hypothetical protein
MRLGPGACSAATPLAMTVILHRINSLLICPASGRNRLSQDNAFPWNWMIDGRN